MNDPTRRWIVTVAVGLIAACHGAEAPADTTGAGSPNHAASPTMQPAAPGVSPGQVPGYGPIAVALVPRVGPIVAPAARGTSGPGPIEPTGVPADASIALPPGAFVQLSYSGTWYEAQVLRAESAGRLRVRYVGWGAEWDETVDRSRLRVGGPIVRPPVAPTTPPTPPTPVPGSGPPITPGDLLAPGAAVQIEWGSSWYHGTVLSAAAPGGDVRVHYAGYGPEWDETVPRARLRFDK